MFITSRLVSASPRQTPYARPHLHSRLRGDLGRRVIGGFDYLIFLHFGAKREGFSIVALKLGYIFFQRCTCEGTSPTFFIAALAEISSLSMTLMLSVYSEYLSL